MVEGASQPTQLNVSDIDGECQIFIGHSFSHLNLWRFVADMFLPSPSDLLVNLQACRPLVEQLLETLSSMFESSHHTQSALGAALQAAYKMAAPTGGRITLFQV